MDLMPELQINWYFVEAHDAGFMKTVTKRINSSNDCPVCSDRTATAEDLL